MNDERNELMLVSPDQMMALATQQEAQIRELQQVVSTMGMLMATMERRIQQMERSRVTITARQAKALAGRIRDRVEAICAKYALDAKRDGGTFRSAIRREVLRQYGIEDLHDMPLAYYELAGEFVDNWSSYKLVQKVRSKEA